MAARSPAPSRSATPAIAGVELITTLDRSVQYSVEQALLRQVQLTGAKGGQVIVMDTDTGDVIAMATVVRRDGVPVVSSGNWSAVGAYEPGSVGKIITMAGALEDGAVDARPTTFTVPWTTTARTTRTTASCTTRTRTTRSRCRCATSSSSRRTSARSTSGQAIGYERQYHYLTAFGLGRAHRARIPRRVGRASSSRGRSGRVPSAARSPTARAWRRRPIQLAAAVNVIANDGTYVAPRLVIGTVGADGEITDAEPSATHRVVSPETAAEMQSMMRDVVCDGHRRRRPRSQGLSVAGKTGTAYKALDNGTYTDEDGKHMLLLELRRVLPGRGSAGDRAGVDRRAAGGLQLRCASPPPRCSARSSRRSSTSSASSRRPARRTATGGEALNITAFPGHAGRMMPLARWRSLARNCERVNE